MSKRRSRRQRRADLALHSREERRSVWTRWVRGTGAFLREYTAGLDRREIKRLFGDAPGAYTVLTREHAKLPEPRGRYRRLLFRARLAFLGLSYKLTPARRLVFALSLICLVVALTAGDHTYDTVAHGQTVRISISFAPFWFLLCAGGLILLLALELVDRVRVRDELQVARELQAELLPRGEIALPGYGVAHSYRTANEVSGDYYEVMTLPDGRVALMVGDATGHGMASGLVMAIANATLKTALDLDPDPRRVIALLNRTLCGTGSRRTFMTVFYALLQPATGELWSVCAGHPFPLVRRAGGRLEELGRGGLPLGVRDNLAPEPQVTTLAPGDLLVLYTDGLAEAVNARDDAFGYDRIADLVRPGGTPRAVHDRILAAFDGHVGDQPLRDDLTLLVIARGGEPAAAQAAAPTTAQVAAPATARAAAPATAQTAAPATAPGAAASATPFTAAPSISLAATARTNAPAAALAAAPVTAAAKVAAMAAAITAGARASSSGVPPRLEPEQGAKAEAPPNPEPEAAAPIEPAPRPGPEATAPIEPAARPELGPEPGTRTEAAPGPEPEPQPGRGPRTEATPGPEPGTRTEAAPGPEPGTTARTEPGS